MRLAVPTTIALDDLDDAVAKTFERALDALSRAGALIERIEVPEFLDVGMMKAKGGFAASESYAWHRYLDRRARATSTIPASASASCAAKASAPPTISISSTRGDPSSRAPNKRIAPYDALVLPTTANTPPKIADLADDKAFTTENLRALRNCTLINTLDGCAISLPAHREGEVPVGLMLAAAGGSDRRIFELAAGMESIIRV